MPWVKSWITTTSFRLTSFRILLRVSTMWPRNASPPSAMRAIYRATPWTTTIMDWCFRLTRWVLANCTVERLVSCSKRIIFWSCKLSRIYFTARHFITRALLSAENFVQAQLILRDNGVGAADGCSVNMTFLKYVHSLAWISPIVYDKSTIFNPIKQARRWPVVPQCWNGTGRQGSIPAEHSDCQPGWTHRSCEHVPTVAGPGGIGNDHRLQCGTDENVQIVLRAENPKRRHTDAGRSECPWAHCFPREGRQGHRQDGLCGNLRLP